MLTLASINAEALARTRATRKLHLYSRPRDELWRKGATPGNTTRSEACSRICPSATPSAAGDIAPAHTPSGQATHPYGRCDVARPARC